ncbi:hypothetical protein C8R46DRAFT_1271420 [Mycena filopes]|nr:hypothetical protein C8R46DRAFT_1271420 [Mycena filopes]
MLHTALISSMCHLSVGQSATDRAHPILLPARLRAPIFIRTPPEAHNPPVNRPTAQSPGQPPYFLHPLLGGHIGSQSGARYPDLRRPATVSEVVRINASTLFLDLTASTPNGDALLLALCASRGVRWRHCRRTGVERAASSAHEHYACCITDPLPEYASTGGQA